MKQILIFVLIFGCLSAEAQVLEFGEIDSLFAFIEKRSAVIQVNQQQSLLAKWTKISALGNTINFKSPISASYTNNTQLPVSYLPGEAFGGKPGSFREIQIGQQYVSTYNLSPQIDLINPAAWMRVKSAVIIEKLTETNNKLARKNLYESIAAAWYNALSSQEQLRHLEKSKAIADSLEMLIGQKLEQGLVRAQDWNNAKINTLMVDDKLMQTKASMENNLNNLSILCDLTSGEKIQLKQAGKQLAMAESVKTNPSLLLQNQSQWQTLLNQNELKSNRWQSFSPTLSLIFNQSWQQNSNEGFFRSDAFRFNANSIGLKLSIPFPVDAVRLSQNYTSKITYQISEINSKHAAIQSQMAGKQLDLEYERNLKSFENYSQVLDLKQDNFEKSKHQFEAGILPTEQLLNAFSELVNAEINQTSTKSALQYAITKISIHNSIQ